jgi:hypothetical protein
VDDENQITLANDAIADAHNRTHYADFKSVMELEQLRFTVKSVMNTNKTIPDNPVVVMPEMQLFGLPTTAINAGAVATVSYLKAEDANGHLHDILGRHQRLTYQRYSSTTYFRFYLGTVEHLKSNDQKLYFDIYAANGTKTSLTAQNIPASVSSPMEFSTGSDYRTAMAYYEIYINSANDEKIILSSGYTGGQAQHTRPVPFYDSICGAENGVWFFCRRTCQLHGGLLLCEVSLDRGSGVGRRFLAED